MTYLVVVVLGIAYVTALGLIGPMTGEEARLLRDNALSLAFGGLFLATLVGPGARRRWPTSTPSRSPTGSSRCRCCDYVTSSSFGVDVMENWQSEYLQFFLYIFPTVWLVQRGSTESKQPSARRAPESDEEQKVGRYATRGLAGLGEGRGLADGAVLAVPGLADGRAVPAHLGGVVGRRLGGLQQRAARPSGRTR